MNTKEQLAKIKSLLSNVDFTMATPPPAPATKKVSAPVKAKPTLTKIKQNTDGSPDMQTLMIAIAELQEYVPVLSQYADLKEAYNAQSKRIAQLEASFKAHNIAMSQDPASIKKDLQASGLFQSKETKLKKYFK